VGEFDGLVAAVTGGASGIGFATAEMLRDRGATVAALDLAGTGPDGTTQVRCDVGDRGSVDQAIQTVVDQLGQLDILINNAGIGAQGDIAANDDDEWRRVLDTNVIGIARVTAAALPHLKRSDHACVVNTCSVVALVGVPNRALYSASKGAVMSLTLAMAVDHVADGIRVNAVAPGTADTPWVNRLLDAAPDPQEAARSLRARQPIGRLVSAEEVAHAIVSLASPLAGATTGTILQVDGGMASLRPAR
jgi:NAD(P)-dependent dehydrogenase (short-subunit alcohol dehydrogenase family)